MFTQAALLALAALTPLVNAHGSFSGIVIDGVRYDGPIPNNGGGQQFVIREVNTVDPIKGASNGALSCGSGAPPAALVADANPGSVVGFEWRNGENGPWVHNTGPVLTYMASCGDRSCTEFDASQGEWFKIDEKGRKDDGSWFMSDYNNDLFHQLTVTLPTNLPAGEYLVRHELIGLHNAMAQGGAEFYAGCAQIRLSAPSRADAKLPTEVVTFPGGYSDTDPGILVPDVYNPGSAYTFPGPQVVNNSEGGVADTGSGSDAGSGDGSGNGSGSGSDGSDGTPTSSEVAAPSATSGSGCGSNARKMKKRVYKRMIRHEVRKAANSHSNSAVKAKRNVGTQAQQAVNNVVKREAYHPVHANSRVMRGLNLN